MRKHSRNAPEGRAAWPQPPRSQDSAPQRHFRAVPAAQTPRPAPYIRSRVRWDVEQDRHGAVVDQRHLHIGTEFPGSDVGTAFPKRLDVAVVEFLRDRGRCGGSETRSVAAPGVRGQGELGDRQHGTADVEHGTVHGLGPVRKHPRREGSFRQTLCRRLGVAMEHRHKHQETPVDPRDLAIGNGYRRFAHSLQQGAQ